MLQMIPIWFSTGVVLSILMPLTNGVTLIAEPVFSKEVFVRDIKKYRPSICLTATSLWMYVMECKDMENADLSHFIYPFTGGEKVQERDEIRMNEFLNKHGCSKNLYKGYGMCELGSTVATFGDAEHYKSKYGGTRYPMLNALVAAFDIESDEELKYGQHGEIRVCSPARMKGYYKNPEATDAFFKTDSQGRVWGCTGDIGYVDKDGEVFILGRATDHYRREDGEIVYLFDIEDVILKDEAVNQCKVVDIQKDGRTALVAHLVLREDVTDADAVLKRIREHFEADDLPDYMIPDYYKIRESMPVHSNGKRDVDTLRNDQTDLRE